MRSIKTLDDKKERVEEGGGGVGGGGGGEGEGGGRGSLTPPARPSVQEPIKT